jgi:hypothetical protein
VQEKVGIGPDELEALRGLICEAMRDELRRMAGGAAGVVEDLLAAEHLRVAHVAPGRYAEVQA